MQANYKNNEHKDFSALPSGNYEMIIKSAQEKATKNGSESLQLDLVVRNDLDGVTGLKIPMPSIIIAMSLWTIGNAKLLISTIWIVSNTFLKLFKFQKEHH